MTEAETNMRMECGTRRQAWMWVVFMAVMGIAMAPATLAQPANAGAPSNLAGSWQGTLQVGAGQRLVLKIRREGAEWKGVAYNLDDPYQAYEGRNTTQMSFDGSSLRFAVAPIDLTFEGKLNADGGSVAGTATQAGQPHPLTLVRAEGDAAWAIPEPQKAMATNADPDWEVVTVKPTDPTVMNASTGMEGRQFVLTNRSVETMFLMGYSVHKKQIVNAPEWARTDRWDVRGVLDVPGQPSLPQMQSLIRKLLAERFGLVTHMEKREMEVYALKLAKGGQKMTPSAGDPNGVPNENDRENGGQRTMQATNISPAEFALMMTYFMDRPVVDQTGLTGRYDFQWKYTFDEMRVPTDGTAAPSVFTAIEEQLGLKLEPVRATTDVMVLDKLERPGKN
jgi:uncharacterized protein (TIGR03435 family)